MYSNLYQHDSFGNILRLLRTDHQITNVFVKKIKVPTQYNVSKHYIKQIKQFFFLNMTLYFFLNWMVCKKLKINYVNLKQAHIYGELKFENVNCCTKIN